MLPDWRFLRIFYWLPIWQRRPELNDRRLRQIGSYRFLQPGGTDPITRQNFTDEGNTRPTGYDGTQVRNVPLRRLLLRLAFAKSVSPTCHASRTLQSAPRLVR